MTATIKTLDAFDSLSAAEAEVFERAAEKRELPKGSAVPTEGHVVLLVEGALAVEVSTGGGSQPFGVLAPGGLMGETNLFEKESLPLSANAETDSVCLVWTLPEIKNAFRYSRTGAAKLMAIFSASLSQKIRWANALLHKTPSSTSSPMSQPREFDAVDMKRLRSFSAPRDYESGDVIFEEGDQGGELFVIAEGQVEIVKRTDEGPMTLAELTEGDFFGEMAFVDDSPRSAGAVAKSKLHVHVLPAGSLERIFDYNVGTGLLLTNLVCKIMSRRLHATVARITA